MPQKHPPSRIILIHGNDDFRIDQQARALLKERCADAMANEALTTLDGGVDTVDQSLYKVREVMNSIQSLSMFSPQNATWLKEITFLHGTLFKSDSVKEAVETLQDTLGKGLGPEQFLLLTVRGKLDKRSRFLKALSPVAEIVECSRKTKDWEIKKEAVDELQAGFSALGIKAPVSVLQEMVARIGGDSRLLKTELTKLELYLGERKELTMRDVDLLVPVHQEAQMFLLGDCIGNRDLGRAMQLLQQLETQGASTVGVMAMLHNSLREMAYLGACVHERKASVRERGQFGQFEFSDPEAEAEFQVLVGDKKRSPFRLFQLGRQGQRFTRGQLDRMVRLSAETYDAFFQSSAAQYELLRILILRIFYECSEKAA